MKARNVTIINLYLIGAMLIASMTSAACYSPVKRDENVLRQKGAYFDNNDVPTGWGYAAGFPVVYDGGPTVIAKLDGCIAVVEVNQGTELAKKSATSLQAVVEICREAANSSHYRPGQSRSERCDAWSRDVLTAAATMPENTRRDLEREYREYRQRQWERFVRGLQRQAVLMVEYLTMA